MELILLLQGQKTIIENYNCIQIMYEIVNAYKTF